ncbi:class I SAM-dependent methyltransferase [Mycobacterium intermedium]|uniref:class I SAM-dependent methyltransferase n=1 Tax=Mycobacterium intermedium TaxID=28445 RepID=UPI000A5AADFC|nr:class I SAM-dependent methyltransferase [Mycobacterium intermedium]
MRREGDTWDPATGVGVTATFGAAVRAVATSRGLMHDPYADPLVRAAGVEYFTQVIDGKTLGFDESPDAEKLMEILVLHAQFLDNYLADAGRAGIRQVVLLASGLDTRPYRLWWPAGTTVYEIDQPDVVDFKNAVLREVGAKLTAHRRAIGVDLRQDWLAALRRVGFDTTQPTVWVAENLFVGYLPSDAQNRLLQSVTTVSAAGSRLAADHMPTWTAVQLDAGRTFVDGWRRVGLNVDLAALTYQGEYRDVPEYLADHGWETVDRDIAELRATLGIPARKPVPPRDLAVSPRYVTAVRV